METKLSDTALLDVHGHHWLSEAAVMESGAAVSVRSVDFVRVGAKVGLKVSVGACELGFDFTPQEAQVIIEMLGNALTRLDAVKGARERRKGGAA